MITVDAEARCPDIICKILYKIETISWDTESQAMSEESEQEDKKMDKYRV